MHLSHNLALYKIGQGEPILLMPYPHGFTLNPMADNPLVPILTGLKRQVLTFDPPGSFNSSRAATVDMAEMLACTRETLNYFGIDNSIDLVGHSMGSLCALGFALEKPRAVSRLVLVGAISGWPAVLKYGQHRFYRWRDPRLYKLLFWGSLFQLNLATLKTHKQLFNLITYDSFVDKKYAPTLEIEAGDGRLPPPRRMAWNRSVKTINYRERLPELRSRVLVCAGRYDPQTPLACNREVAQAIPQAQLVIFDRSGHSPFVEEAERFAELVGAFLN